MIRLAVGDNLLVRQTALVKTSPWQYRILDITASGATTIASDTALTTDYEIVALTGSTWEGYEGKMLLLEILDNSGVLIEDDTFLVSGIYGKYEEIRYLTGLLGENQKKESSSGDFSDGYRTQADVTLYTDATLATALETYDWTQGFVSDFTPDHRYHRNKINQKAT